MISGSNNGFEIWIYIRGNSIYKNNITSNNKGVYIYYPGYASNSNLFYHNNFIENAENNTWDECTNNWYNETLEEGNYYDDYVGTDADEDGIGDVPYNISEGDNQDLYPLMEPYVENKPPIAKFTYSPENPVVDETIIFNASLSFGEAFVLKANVTYNYTIRTGSYPQIHHTDRLEVDKGVITCSKFMDANGERYEDWIPAIRLE